MRTKKVLSPYELEGNRPGDTKRTLWWFFKSDQKKPPNFTFLQEIPPFIVDETIECTTSKWNRYETRNNEHSVFRPEDEITEEYRNAARGCSKGKDRASIELNNFINALNVLAFEKHKELMLEQALITPKLLLKRIFGKDEEIRALLGTMQQEITDMEKVVNIDYSPITINRYRNVLKKLQMVLPSFYNKEDITFHELTPEFIKAFDVYWKTEASLRRNTIVRYMKCFKKITDMALAKEWMRKDPFYGYKMEQDETDPVFLTYDELKVIINPCKELGAVSLQQ